MKKAAQATPNWRLKQERERHCWSQLEVADQIGTTSLNVSRWERGITFPTPHFRQELCTLFGKSASELGLLQDETTDAEKVSEAEAQLPQQEIAGSQPEAEVEQPWNVAFWRNPFFTGRESLLQRLHEQLHNTRRASLNQSQALTGLGGIGKTQTAVEYAWRYRDEYTAVLWVRAANRETLITDYVVLARLLSLPGRDAQEQMLVVEEVKRWLEQHTGWLLILDNADELALVEEFLPARGKGHVLLTTRAQATGRIAESLPVERLEPSESVLLLLRRAKLLDHEGPLDNVSRAVRISAQALVEELDGLPLALDQIGAYIEETGCSLAEYLALYRSRRMALLKRQSSISSDYPHSVSSTWSLSFGKVEQANPAAAELLRLCAYLYPDAIPEAFLTEGASELGPVLEPVASDPLLLNEAIQVLRAYSLIKRDAEAKLLVIHRLVQVVLKDGMDQETRRLWAERAVRMVNCALPEVEFATWDRCESCLPHALVCDSLIEQYNFGFPEAARLLDHAGYYLRERGIYAQAEPLSKHALAIYEQALGLEHPETITALDHLAWLFQAQGYYEQAEPFNKRTLAIRERVLGPEHPGTATGLDHLATLYQLQGRYEEAEPLFQRALAIREQALDSNHSDVADSLNNLALNYDYQGKYEQAEPLYQRALTHFEKTLGPEHPETAISLHNLATLYLVQDKYEQAEPLLQRALAILEKSLGSEHPRTAASLDYLAQLYARQGNYAQAEPLYQRALAIRQMKLGDDHPDVAKSLHRLAELYVHQSKHEQAEPLYQAALAICMQKLGPEHPDTIKVRENYTGLLRTMERKVTTEKT